MPSRPLIKLRKLALALPEAHEVEAWGSETFRVKNKIFAMFADANDHHGGGRPAVWVKAGPGNQPLMVRDAPRRFFVPPYVGPSGWVGVWLDEVCDWEEIAELLRDAYKLTAPKKLIAALDAPAKKPAKSPRRSPRRSGRSKMAARKIRSYPYIHPKTRASWRTWLSKNAAKSTGVWLVFFRATTGKRKLPYADAVEEALCFGWIDSVINPMDESRYAQLFTPRKPKSEWSRLNKTRVERLEREGVMHPAGLAAIATAKANGSWAKIDHVENMTVPPELERALAKNAKARKQFEAFSPSTRKGMLHWLNSAKREETRKTRVKEIIARLEAGQKLRQQTLPPN